MHIAFACQVPAILNQAVPASSEEIDKVIEHTLKCAYRYTSLLESSAHADQFGNVSRKLLTDALVNVRQHEICLKTLMHDIITCAKNVETLQLQLGSRLDQLKNIVLSKSTIPTAQVYPHFIQLSNIWIGFQDELVLISVLSNVLYNLEPFAMNHRQLLNDEVLAPLLKGIEIKSDADRTKSVGLFLRLDMLCVFEAKEVFLFFNFSSLSIQGRA